MSSFSNSIGNVTVDFSMQFDLTSTPTLKITDTSTYSAAQNEVKIFIKITRPDGIIRNHQAGGVADISGTSSNLNVFEYILPLSSTDGQVSQGTYKVEYSFYIKEDSAPTKIKSYNFNFSKITLTSFQDIDEFTPLIKLKDTTPNYNVTNYTLNSVNRVFSASNIVSGSSISNKTSTGLDAASREYNIVDTDGFYHDARYTVNTTVTATYTSTNFNWATVIAEYKKIESLKVYKVPTKVEMLSYFGTLRNLIETYDGYNSNLHKRYSDNLEFVITNFDLLVRRLDSDLIDDDNTDILRDILSVLRNDVPREHTLEKIVSVSPQIYAVTVNYGRLTNVPEYNPFKTYEKTFPTSDKEWEIIHSLNKKPSVTLVDDYENIMYAEVEYVNLNIIKITFNTKASGKAYLN
jgi:hypothetical protein